MSDFKAKMHQIRFRLGSAQDPAGGAYSVPPDPLARFKGAASRQGGEGKWMGKEGGGKGREDEGREGREREWRREGGRENGRDGTGHVMGKGKEEGEGKGGEGLQPPPQTLIPVAAAERVVYCCI